MLERENGGQVAKEEIGTCPPLSVSLKLQSLSNRFRHYGQRATQPMEF